MKHGLVLAKGERRMAPHTADDHLMAILKRTANAERFDRKRVS